MGPLPAPQIRAGERRDGSNLSDDRSGYRGARESCTGGTASAPGHADRSRVPAPGSFPGGLVARGKKGRDHRVPAATSGSGRLSGRAAGPWSTSKRLPIDSTLRQPRFLRSATRCPVSTQSPMSGVTPGMFGRYSTPVYRQNLVSADVVTDSERKPMLGRNNDRVSGATLAGGASIVTGRAGWASL